MKEANLFLSGSKLYGERNKAISFYFSASRIRPIADIFSLKRIHPSELGKGFTHLTFYV